MYKTITIYHTTRRLLFFMRSLFKNLKIRLKEQVKLKRIQGIFLTMSSNTERMKVSHLEAQEVLKEIYSELIAASKAEEEAIAKRVITQKKFDDAEGKYRKIVSEMTDHVIKQQKKLGKTLARLRAAAAEEELHEKKELKKRKKSIGGEAADMSIDELRKLLEEKEKVDNLAKEGGKGPWSYEEKQKLRDMVEKSGKGAWRRKAESFENRTPDMLCHQWYIMEQAYMEDKGEEVNKKDEDEEGWEQGEDEEDDYWENITVDGIEYQHDKDTHVMTRCEDFEEVGEWNPDLKEIDFYEYGEDKDK